MNPFIKIYCTISSVCSQAMLVTCALAAYGASHMISANLNRRICKVAATLFASLALPIVTASVAWAADTILPNNGRAAPVSVADLDTSTIEGQLIAQERVRSKARTLCNRIFDPLDLGPHEHYVQCVATATDQAMRRILAAGFARAVKVPPAPGAFGNTSIREDGQAPRARVSLTDLDLSTAQGVRAAHERLHEAARRLCAAIAEDSDVSHQPNFVTCVGQTMANAQIDVQKMAL